MLARFCLGQLFSIVIQDLIDGGSFDQFINILDVAEVSMFHASGSKREPCYTRFNYMPKRMQTKIGPRDIELMTAIDRCPLTVAQLRLLSETFPSPFSDDGNLRRRLRNLSQAGLLKSWRYAIASEGQSPKYFKLSRDGYRVLNGVDAAMPRRRYFEEMRTGHHHHSHCLAELVVHLIVTGHKEGIVVRDFARENSVKLEANGFVLYPDCAFQLVTKAGKGFNFVAELDNGTERIRSTKDVESIERKIRGYDAHQSQFAADDSKRYLVLFVTTRSESRIENILNVVAAVQRNPQRTVFVGCGLHKFLGANPISDSLLRDHRGLHRCLLPQSLACQPAVGLNVLAG